MSDAVLELSKQEVETLTGSLKQASADLKETRAEMVKSNESVKALLEKQSTLEKQGGNNGEAVQAVKKQLEETATKLETLSQQYSNLNDQVRREMRTIGQSNHGENNDAVFSVRGGRGSVFESRQQALELGMWAMSTMKQEGEARSGARRWLREHKQDLRYLPGVTQSLVQELGADWLKQYDAIRAGGVAALQDLGGTTTPGSVLVAPEFAAMLIRNVEEYGVFRRNATIWPMASDTVYIPIRKSGLSVYWENEATPGSTTDPDFGLLGMAAKKMMMLHKFSNELKADAMTAIRLGDIIMAEFALAFATEEDRIGFNGTGAGGNSPGYAGFIGVLGSARDGDYQPISVTGAATNNLTTEITEAKLRAMTGLLHTWARANAKWYMSRTVHADLDAINMGTAGGPVVKYADNGSARIMGYPVEDTEAMPASPSAASTPVLALGDLRKGWILGDRLSPEIETSEHYSFNTDQMTMRAKARIGFMRAQGDSMVVYVTGTA